MYDGSLNIDLPAIAFIVEFSNPAIIVILRVLQRVENNGL